jgi:hypothetical protein
MRGGKVWERDQEMRRFWERGCPRPCYLEQVLLRLEPGVSEHLRIRFCGVEADMDHDDGKGIFRAIELWVNNQFYGIVYSLLGRGARISKAKFPAQTDRISRR